MLLENRLHWPFPIKRCSCWYQVAAQKYLKCFFVNVFHPSNIPRTTGHIALCCIGSVPSERLFFLSGLMTENRKIQQNAKKWRTKNRRCNKMPKNVLSRCILLKQINISKFSMVCILFWYFIIWNLWTAFVLRISTPQLRNCLSFIAIFNFNSETRHPTDLYEFRDERD